MECKLTHVAHPFRLNGGVYVSVSVVLSLLLGAFSTMLTVFIHHAAVVLALSQEWLMLHYVQNF